MLPKNEKTADAAVAKNTNFTYALVDARQYRTDNSNPSPYSIAYSMLSSTVNSSYGVADFTPASKTAHITKVVSSDIVTGYVVFSASIDVPAMTEYNVTFSYDFTMVRTVSSTSSTINAGAELFFLGTTDTSSSLEFYGFDRRTNNSAPFVNGLYWEVKGNTTETLNDRSSKSNITFTNTTNSSKPFTVYFGLSGSGGRGTTYIGGVDATVVVSEKVSITALTTPSVDISSTPYNGNNQNFTFAYDNARIAVTKAEYTPNVGTTQTLYDYDIVNDTVISGTNPLNASGVMLAKESGTYTVYFDILNDCGAVWNSTTEDQSTKSVSFTITKKKLTVPTVSAPKQYTGAPQQFNLIDFNAGQDIKMDGVTAATSGQAVTDASGNTPTDTTGVFLATVVDKYTVMLTPRDTNNYEWDDATGGSGAKSVIFEITEKELLSSAPVSSAVNGIGDAEWQYGDSSVTMTVTDGRVSGESVNLLFYYDVVGGTSKSNVLMATTTGNTSVITMPANIPVGKYTLTVELDGATGNNANYKITTNNTLNFEVTSGTVDPSTYAWVYTKDGAAGSTIANNGKLPFELQAGSTVNGVKYELSIQIPAADASVVAEDTSKYVNGYLTRSGEKVGMFTTTVALKSIDPTFQFEVGGVKQNTTEVTLSWEIEKGTFDLSNVKWEYSLDGSAWADYDPANPPQYNDGNYITVRVKASTLPLGLTLDPLYAGSEEYNVSTTGYTATISASDLVYNTSNFNAPNTSLLNLNWEIAKKNLFTGFKNAKDTYSNSNGSGTIIIKQLNVPAGFESYITYKYYDVATGVPVTLADIKAAADPTHEKHYKVEAYIDPAFAANFEVLDNGSVPSDTFVTGSKNMLATVTIDGNDGSKPISVDYDKNDHFDTSLIKVTGDDGINVTDFTVTYYNGKSPVPGNELAAGELPKNAGDYCIAVTLGATAEKKYILATDWFTVKVEPKGIDVPTLGEMIFNGTELKFEDYLGGTWNDYNSIIKLDGKLSDRNVGAGDYVTTLELIDTNYKWIYPSSTVTTTKAIASYAFTAGGTSVTGDEVTATYNWNITPLVVDTTNMWNKGKTGATLNLPQNIKDLIA
ncbi:MAG: hypothetical protein K2G38_06480, partial [Clostridia bacterium]|nr:hypothetical protein [Clostridia bacterium]